MMSLYEKDHFRITSQWTDGKETNDEITEDMTEDQKIYYPLALARTLEISLQRGDAIVRLYKGDRLDTTLPNDLDDFL